MNKKERGIVSGKVLFKTSFRGQGGRIAGSGIVEDNYNNIEYEPLYIPITVKLPNDCKKPEQLNGPVIIIQAAKIKNN